MRQTRTRAENLQMERLKLACADFTFPLLSHENSLQLISMLEFQGVDIGLFEGRSHLWPSKEFKSLKKSARLLKKKVKNLGLEVADVFLQLAPDFVAQRNQPSPGPTPAKGKGFISENFGICNRVRSRSRHNSPRSAIQR